MSDLSHSAKHQTESTLREMIVARHVDKQFVLRHTRSIKEAFVWLVKGRKGDLSEKFHALSDVSFSVKEGETVALLGLNGSGKSTLLKLISGVMLPDEGDVLTRGRVAGLIEVGAGFHPDLTGRDNVYLNGAILGMDKAEIDEKFDDIVAFSEIAEFIDTEVKFYSSGMYLRLAFSVAIHTDPEVLILDEPTRGIDVGAKYEIYTIINRLADAGKAVIVISSELPELLGICDRIYTLSAGRITGQLPREQATQESLMQLMTKEREQV